MYVHVRQHPSVSWWVRRNEINTIPLVALAGVETEATISPWTAVAHRHPNLGDSVHSHTLPSLVLLTHVTPHHPVLVPTPIFPCSTYIEPPISTALLALRALDDLVSRLSAPHALRP
jgi:hypothetical protein